MYLLIKEEMYSLGAGILFMLKRIPAPKLWPHLLDCENKRIYEIIICIQNTHDKPRSS